jgi:hypothetical protein
MTRHRIKWKSAVPQLNSFGILVIAADDGSGGIDWSQSIDPQYDDDGRVQCPAGVGYKITFTLQDNTQTLQVRFDVANPIYVKENDNDPSPTRKGSKQLKPDSCTGNTLVVTNWNYGKKKALRYQLNFVDPAGNELPPYDPIVDNGGGGVQPKC